MFAQEWQIWLLVTLKTQAGWGPLHLLTHVPIMSNFFPLDILVCIYVQILFENGNLMAIVMNVDLMDQKSRRKQMQAREKSRV